jgi:YidC/Oxa1 family membrane protein insertase
MKATNKMKELAPELEKLKKKYGKDKQAYTKAQMDLYKERGANPAAGCLPQIIQLIVLVALYQAFIQVLRTDGEIISKLNEILYPQLHLPAETIINTKFLYLDLAKPDVFPVAGLPFPLPGFFLLAAALTQLISSKMMTPALTTAQKGAAETPGKADDMATSMQTQMTYLFPLLTILIGYSFPSGLVLYWFIFSLIMVVQQYFIGGWGGVEPWLKKLKIKR